MCRGTSTRSPPVFIKLLAQLSSHRLTQGLVKMGLRIYRARNAQYLILQRVEEELFSGRHRAATVTRSAIRPAMPVVVAGPGVCAAQRFDYAEQTTPSRSTSFQLYAFSWA